MQGRFAELLSEVQSAARDEATIRRFTGCYLTEPKSHVVFDPPDTPLALNVFIKLALRHGLELDLKTRMLYDNTNILYMHILYKMSYIMRVHNIYRILLALVVNLFLTLPSPTCHLYS